MWNVPFQLQADYSWPDEFRTAAADHPLALQLAEAL